MLVTPCSNTKIYLKNKKRLYCAFVDYKKAFDFINRSSLWYKLIQQGIQGKFLRILKSLYDQVKTCIKYDGCLSTFYDNNMGLLQGEILSPILFSLYINDFETHFIKDNCPSIELCDINLFLLMYADDTVLLSETPEGLQKMLDSLATYTQTWKLSVNIDKTKILVFRNGGTLHRNEQWFYGGKKLDIVNQFNYLGLLFNYNGKFFQTQKHTAQQGRKAMFSLMSNLRKFKFNIQTQCAVFDTYVNSILSYGAEVWGFHKGPDVEKVHTVFCKKLLGVKKNTPNDFIFCELGRLPLFLNRKLKVIKYWLKLKNTNNIILSTCFEEMVRCNSEWVCNVKLLLDELRLSYLWNSGTTKYDYYLIETRFLDVQKQIILSNVKNSVKGVLYRYLIDNYVLQQYLQKPIEVFDLR